MNKKEIERRLDAYYAAHYSRYEFETEWYVNPNDNTWKFDIPSLMMTVTLTYYEENDEVLETRAVMRPANALKLLCESVFDITWEAVDMIRADMIHVDDSRDLFETVFSLAKRFEDGNHGEDYLSDVVEFAQNELIGQYGEE